MDLTCPTPVDEKEDITPVLDWFGEMFRHAVKEYQKAASLNSSTDTETAGQVKSKVRTSENILSKALQALGEIAPLTAEMTGPLVDSTAFYDRS